MKKFLVFMVVLIMFNHGAFSDNHKVSEESVLVDWKFSPKIETYMGYTLDTGNMGLMGTATLDLESTIHKKADKEFGKEDGGTYGYIKVEDVKIKIDTDKQNSKYDSTKSGNTSPLLISWGMISGALHLGPVYFNLKHTSHNDQNFIDEFGLDKSDLAFSVLEYSVIPVYTTSQYAGNVAKEYGEVKPGRDAYRSEIVDIKMDKKDVSKNGNPDGGIKETFPTGGLGAFSVGFKSKDLLDVRLGVSTQYTYKQHVPHNKTNPTALSLYFELLAVENLTMKMAVTSSMGVNGNDFMYDGNPITVGMLTGYTLGNITPYVGAEFRMERKQEVDVNSPLSGAVKAKLAKLAKPGNIKYKKNIAGNIIIDPTSILPQTVSEAVTARTVKDNKYIGLYSYHFVLGVTYDWKQLGEDDEEGDHLAMAPKDEDATDGVSLGLIYGATPHKVFRETMVPFLGAKIALWESEDTDKPGIIPGLKAGLIVNYNLALGTKYKYKNKLMVGDNEVPNESDIEIGQRHDMGLGFETSYTIGFIKPHLGFIYKTFDILKGKDTVKLKDADKSDNLRLAEDALDDDFRIRLGVDVIKLVKNTTFKLWWESGNLINKESRRTFDDKGGFTYSDSDFYTNNQGDSNSSSVFWNSHAKLGFIALGAEIKY